MLNKRHKPGNPKWGRWKPGIIFGVQVTAFEKKAQELQLTSFAQMKKSDELRSWAYRNRNTRYVPEALLKAWNLYVDTSGII